MNKLCNPTFTIYTVKIKLFRKKNVLSNSEKMYFHIHKQLIRRMNSSAPIAAMKKRRILFYILLLLGFSFQPALSQSLFSINGHVYNTETNVAVANANIAVKDTHFGTSSNSDGLFELSLAAGEYHLQISSVGYATKTVEIRIPGDHLQKLSVALTPIDIVLDNVLILGRYYIFDRAQSIDRELLSVVPAITHISAAEIEKQGAVTLTDAFKFVPGGLVETRGRKTKQFFSVRGQTYPYPDYSINGIWQKEFEETSYFLSALDIESIEIVRSSSALVKGMSGLSGVVDVRTRQPDRELFSLSAKYGGLNSYLTNIRYGNKLDNVTYSTSLSLFGTNGPAGRDGRERIGNFHGSLDWNIHSNLSLATGATYISGSREFVRITEPGTPNILNRQESFDPIHTYMTYAKLKYQQSDASLTELQANLTYRGVDYMSYNTQNQQTSKHSENDYEYSLNLLHNHSLTTTNTLRLGFLYNHWVAPEGKRYYAGNPANVHTWSGVIANEQIVGRFVFDAGLRLISDYIVEWGGFGIEGSAAGLRNVTPIENEFSPLEWQGVFGTSYILSNATSLHYNFAGGTVAPRSRSLLEDGSQPVNEVRLQHDLGFQYNTYQQNEWSVSAFHTTRKDAIVLSGQTVTTDDDQIVELYENVNKRSYGIEISTRTRIPALHSFLFANATFMTGEDEIDGTMKKDEKLPNVILNSGWLFEYSGFDANLFVNYTGPYINNRFVNPQWIDAHGDYSLGDFYSLDFTTGYTLDNRFKARFFIDVKNILDQKYLTVAGYPDPGRMLSTGIKMDF